MRLPLPSRLPALLRLGEHFLTRDAAFAGAARWSRLQRGYATPAEDADAQRDAQGIGATDANMKNEIADNTENADVASDVSPFSPAARRARAVARFRALAAQAAATEPSPAAQFLPSVYNLPERSFGAANSLTLTSLLAANLHLGHAPRHLSHYMRPYVYGERAGIHIINLEHTLVALRRSMNVVREVAARGGAVVFVGTRLAIHKIAVDAARSCGQYFCIEWKEGLITNRERLLKRSTGFDPSKAVQSEPAPGVPPLTKQPKVREHSDFTIILIVG